jgi:2-dehydro-3-deoxygluconokinase
MNPLVVTFGEIMLRLAPPGFERLLQSPLLQATFGGGECNVAVALAGFGTPARFVSVLPDNDLTRAFRGELRRAGVDDSAIVLQPGRFGIYFVEPGANQRGSKVLYDRSGSSIAQAAPGSINWTQALAGATWFHITGITPALSESASALSLEAMQAARDAGATVSIDLNYRKNLWKYGKKAHEVMPHLARLADYIVANEEDCQLALGIESKADVHSGQLDHAHYPDLAENVLAAYPNVRAAAITLRESRSASHNGWAACFHDRTQFLVSRHYEITHIVDRVGSGDSFAGSLIHGLLTMPTPADALEFAVAASCLKHSIPGDFLRFSRDEVLALVKGGGSGRVQR